MDKDRLEAKNRVRSLPFKEKVKHYWYYYKVHVIIAVFIAILAGIFIYQKATAVKPELEAAVYAGSYIPEDCIAATEENFSDWLGGKAVEVYGLAVPEETFENMERVAAIYQKIQSQFAAGTVSAFILDEDMYDYFVSGYESYIEKEYSCEIGAKARKMLGLTDGRRYYYVPRILYQAEQNDNDARAKHENALKIYEKIKKIN